MLEMQHVERAEVISGFGIFVFKTQFDPSCILLSLSCHDHCREAKNSPTDQQSLVSLLTICKYPNKPTNKQGFTDN